MGRCLSTRAARGITASSTYSLVLAPQKKQLQEARRKIQIDLLCRVGAAYYRTMRFRVPQSNRSGVMVREFARFLQHGHSKVKEGACFGSPVRSNSTQRQSCESR